jgi:phage-related protein (TIGR01555 family)
MTSKIQQLSDSFKNFVANLNTDRDKQSGGYYYLIPYTDQQWSDVYRTSWMGRKLVDIPAKDATRKWRDWEAEADQITLIEKEEARLNLPQKVKLALQQSRLFGGSGIYFSVKGDDPEDPLELSTVKKGSLEFITVFPKGVLTPGDIEQDPMSPDYGLPVWYEVSGTDTGGIKIHRSRLAIFVGNEILSPQEMAGVNQGWGDSVLQAAYEAVRNADSIASNIASLVYEAKVDILKIPDLADIMSNDRTRTLLEQRVVMSAQLKGNNGMIVIDKDEGYDQKTFTFTGLPDIYRQALQSVSGAGDIPVTRFLGQSPAGMSSTGESDLKNYYDAVNSMQSLIMTPALHNLDESLLRSVFGSRPEDVSFEWASLWQLSDEQKSKISKETAETIKSLVDSQLFDEGALGEAAANLLIEHSILPAFEYAAPDLEDREFEPGAGIDTRDAMPRTLYVSRKVVNTKDIIDWARAQGIEQMLPASDLHVTVLYSKTPVNWLDMGEDWAGDQRGRLHIKPGGPREIDKFGDGATVLSFISNDLTWRHEAMLANGASSDFDEYSAHITITYSELPGDVIPYQGPIVLGPEIFEEIVPGAQSEIEEVKL